MPELLRAEWLETLLRSGTFWTETVRYLALAAGAGAVVLLLLGHLLRRARLRPLHADARGAAAAVDFVLTFPVLWFFTACVVQFVWLANGSILVHYAAYSAARAARVHAFVYDTDFLDWEKVIRTPLTGPIQAEADKAARFALVSAGSADSRFVYAGPGPVPRAVVDAITAAAGDAQRSEALMRKARYAFDRNNATVKVSRALPFSAGCSLSNVPGLNLTGPNACSPVKATVTFRLPVTVPGAQMIADRCVNGYCYKVAEASVTLL